MRRHFGTILLLAGAVVASPLRGQTLQQLRWAYTDNPSPRLPAMLDSALAARPDDPELLLFASEVRCDRGETAAAAALARRVLALPAVPSELKGSAHLRLGMALYVAENTAGARAEMDTARALGGHAGQLAAWFAFWLGLDERYAGWRTVESEHLRLHVAPGARVDARTLLREREATLAELRQLLGATPPKKIDFFLWPGREAAPRLGAEPIDPADPPFALVHAWPGQSGRHELAEVVAFWAMGPVPPPLIYQGVVRYFELAGADPLPAARESARAAGGRTSIEALWSRRVGTPSPLLEPVGALLGQRLLERGGRERFLQLVKDPTPASARRIYGDLLLPVITEVERDLGG